MQPGSVIRKGMSFADCVKAVREAAVAELGKGTSEFGLWTETGKENVLMGLAVRGKAACTLVFDIGDYDGLKVIAALDPEFYAALMKTKGK